MEALILWLLDRFIPAVHPRRVRARVHRAFFKNENVPHFFVKVTNLSLARDIEVTHVWFEGSPEVPVLLPERWLPVRLRPEETREGWVPEVQVAHIPKVERAGRVRLSNGKVVKTRPDKKIPPEGYVALGGAG